MLTNRPVLVPETSVIRVIVARPGRERLPHYRRAGGHAHQAGRHGGLPQLELLAAADAPAAHDVLRRAAAEIEMGRAVKRVSLTCWIFIGMAAGMALGIAAPGVARANGAGGERVSAADPLDRRAACCSPRWCTESRAAAI